MNSYMSRAEIDEISEGLIKVYAEQYGSKAVQCIDIEHFITAFLSLQIEYAAFAENDSGRIGFLADGETPLLVYLAGEITPYVYPKNTIVLDKFLLAEKEQGRRRFTMAHEAAHHILSKMYAMLSHPKDRHWYPIFYIMANTGMRVGEITGLRWNDIDLDEGIIRVNHTLVYYNHRDEKGCYFSINTPKTKAGEREIPMTDGVKQAFIMEREYQQEAEIESRSHIDGYDDFIFVNRFGDVQNQCNLNKAIRRMMRDCNDEILEKYGADSNPVLLPRFSCHILRHTFATRLCESGVNLKVIQDVLGHADVSTTMDIYVDVTNALKKREIAAFDDYMATGTNL